MIKPKSISWRDWLAARTIRFNSAIAALWTAVLPVVLAVDETDLAILGFSPKYTIIIIGVLSVAASLYNNRLRGKTDRPLKGRANVCKSDLL